MKTLKWIVVLCAYVWLCGTAIASTPAEAVTRFLANSPIPENLRDAMQAAVKSQPDVTRWSGEHDGQLFVVVSAPVPQDQRFRLSTLQRLEVLAKYELLLTKAVLDVYREVKLDDVAALKESLRKTQGKMELAGKSHGVLWKTQVVGKTCVAYAYADAAELKASLTADKNMAVIRDAYRDEIHGRMNDFMKNKQWDKAVVCWQHLHQRRLFSSAIYLDAADCYIQSGQKTKAKSVLDEAAVTTGDDTFYEKLGDFYLVIQEEASATKMFDLALEIFMTK